MSHIPAPPFWPAGSLTFHCITMAPAAIELRQDRDSVNPSEGHTRANSGEDHVGDLHDTSGASIANLENDSGVVVVSELAALSSDGSPGLSNHLCASRDGDSVGDDVVAVVEEEDLATIVLQKTELSKHKDQTCSHLRTLLIKFLMQAVSSVLPSPLQPSVLTLTNWLGA